MLAGEGVAGKCARVVAPRLLYGHAAAAHGVVGTLDGQVTWLDGGLDLPAAVIVRVLVRPVCRGDR